MGVVAIISSAPYIFNGSKIIWQMPVPGPLIDAGYGYSLFLAYLGVVLISVMGIVTKPRFLSLGAAIAGFAHLIAYSGLIKQLLLGWTSMPALLFAFAPGLLCLALSYFLIKLRKRQRAGVSYYNESKIIHL